MKTGLSIFVLFFAFALEAQINLVPNPSFEDTTQCPTDQAQLNYTLSWFSPNGNTPDFFNSCYSATSITPVGIPSNFEGFQLARTGDAYSGIAALYASGNGREYISVRLNSDLCAQKKYCVSFYVSLSDSSMYAINRMGAYFSDTLIVAGNISTLHHVPQIAFPTTSILADKNNWVLVSDTFVASGGERYVTIGNFYDDTATVVDTIQGTWYNAYYYFDDISVVDIGWVGIASPTLSNNISVFPNPSSGNFQLKGNLPSNSQLHIYNLLGQEIIQPLSLPQGNQSVPVELNLSEGIYIYRIISGKDILCEEKLVIVK